MKSTGIIPMYSFKISIVGESLEITTKMLSLLSPRMALENNGFEVDDRCFKKGDISFNYYRSNDDTVSIRVWDGDVETAHIYREKFINVLIVRDCVILSSPTCKVTINV